jgi:hypothetical protein
MDYVLDYINNNASLVQALSSLVQALSSFLLLIVTIVYVALTYRLIHAGHRSHVQVISFTIRENKWALRLKNYGPALAKNLRVKTVVQKSVGLYSSPSGQLMEWIDDSFLAGDGPFVLEPDQEADYYFELHTITFDDPFYITWRSVTGEAQKTKWLMKVNFGSRHEIIPLSFLRSVKWSMGRMWVHLL